MKTTIDLDDNLLADAKLLAKKRNTSLKTLFENSLRRELQHLTQHRVNDPSIHYHPDGMATSKRNAPTFSTEDIQSLLDDEII